MSDHEMPDLNSLYARPVHKFAYVLIGLGGALATIGALTVLFVQLPEVLFEIRYASDPTSPQQAVAAASLRDVVLDFANGLLSSVLAGVIAVGLGLALNELDRIAWLNMSLEDRERVWRKRKGLNPKEFNAAYGINEDEI